MNKASNQRNESIHLYDPEKEGWTSYDINYTNALRKNRIIKNNIKINTEKNRRYVA